MNENFSRFYLSEKVVGKLQNQLCLQNQLEKGQTGQDILEFSEEVMSQFYKSAYELFENKDYEESCDAFLFLILLNPNKYEYWLGFGMGTQMCHHYEAAIDAYEMAALIDIASPVPYFYLAKCLFAIHDRESALQALNLAIETAGDQEEFQDLKHQANLAKNILLRTM